jgi:hypothetical protein
MQSPLGFWVLRRSLPFDSGPLEDEEIGAASAALFDCL